MLQRVAGWVKALVPPGGFAHDAVLLVGSTAIAQGITLLLSPVLTRLYTPEDFGALAVFTSLLMILTTLSSLSYERAIPLPDGSEEAISVVHLCTIILLCSSSLIGLAVLGLEHSTAEWAVAVASELPLWLLPIAVFGAGLYQTLTHWAVREGAFTALARTRVAQGVLRGLVQVALGLCGVRPLGLLLGQAVGQFAGSGWLGLQVWRHSFGTLWRPNTDRLLQVASRYRKFPLFNTWAAVFNIASIQVPVLIMAGVFGTHVTGLYSLGYRLMQLPSAFVGQAVAQVFLSRAARANEARHLASLTMAVFRRLCLIALPLTMLVGLIAPELFSVVFGSEWRQAGVYAQWQAPWLLFGFVASPLSPLTTVLEKQREEAFFQAIVLSGRVGTLLVGSAMDNPSLGIGLYSGFSALCSAGYLVWIMRLSGNSIAPAVLWLAREALVILVLFLPTVIGKVVADEAGRILVVLLLAVLSAVLAFARLAITLPTH